MFYKITRNLLIPKSFEDQNSIFFNIQHKKVNLTINWRKVVIIYFFRSLIQMYVTESVVYFELIIKFLSLNYQFQRPTLILKVNCMSFGSSLTIFQNFGSLCTYKINNPAVLNPFKLHIDSKPILT